MKKYFLAISGICAFFLLTGCSIVDTSDKLIYQKRLDCQKVGQEEYQRNLISDKEEGLGTIRGEYVYLPKSDRCLYFGGYITSSSGNIIMSKSIINLYTNQEIYQLTTNNGEPIIGEANYFDEQYKKLFELQEE